MGCGHNIYATLFRTTWFSTSGENADRIGSLFWNCITERGRGLQSGVEQTMSNLTVSLTAHCSTNYYYMVLSGRLIRIKSDMFFCLYYKCQKFCSWFEGKIYVMLLNHSGWRNACTVCEFEHYLWWGLVYTMKLPQSLHARHQASG